MILSLSEDMERINEVLPMQGPSEVSKAANAVPNNYPIMNEY